MFGTNYKNGNTMFYTGLLIGGVAGMVATVWYLGDRETSHKNKSMFDVNVNQKVNNLDDKEKDRMFNNFINPDKDENDLLDDFNKTNLTN